MSGEDINVRIGAETGGVEAGAARASGAVRGFGLTVEKTRQAAKIFAQEVSRAFQAPSSGINQEAVRTAAAMTRLRDAVRGVSQGVDTFNRTLRQTAPAATQASSGLDRASVSATRFGQSAGGARAAVGALIVALGVLGFRQMTDGFRDAAFAQFGFEAALSATTGGAQQAASELAFVEAKAADLGLVLQDSVAGFVALTGATKGTSLQGQHTRDVWEGLMTAGVALNRSNEQLKRGQEGINQIASKGVVSMEELRQQLAEAIPGAMQIGARAMNLTTREFVQTVSAGKMLSEDFLPKFAAQLKREFGPALETAMNTPLGRARRELAEFANATFKAKQAAGNSFLTAMVVGVKELNEQLNSPDGIKTAADLGRTLGEAFTAGARGVIILAENIDKVVMAAQILAGGALIRWLVVSAAEAKAAAVAYAVKGAAARSAAASATAGALTEAASNVGLRAGLQAVAVAEVQKAEAALVAAKAHLAVTNAAATEARQTLAATAAGVAYTEAKVAATAANARLIAAENGVAAAAGRVAVAQGVATASTTAMTGAMALARGAASGLLALLGGPWGAVFLVGAGAVWALHNEVARLEKQNRTVTESLAEYRREVDRDARAVEALDEETLELAGDQAGALVATADLTGETDKLADAHWRAAAGAKAQAIETQRLKVIQAGEDLSVAREAFGTRQTRERAVASRQSRDAPLQGRLVAGEARIAESQEYKNLEGSIERTNAEVARLNALRAEPLASFDVPERPESPDAGGGSGSGSGGAARVARWQNELDEMLVAEGNFFGESAATELAFWESKRALTTAGSEDRMQVERKLYQLRRSIARDDLRAELEDLQTRQQMAQGNFDEQLRLQDEILARTAQAYGEDSREYQRALQDKVRLEQAAAADRLQIEQDRLDAVARAREAEVQADEAIAAALLDNERANLDLLADLGVISAQERGERARALAAELRAIEVASAEEQYRIQRQLIEDQLALENLRPDARRTLNAQLEQLDMEHAQRVRVTTAQNALAAADDVRDAMREAANAWRSAASVAGGGVDAMLNNAVTGARSFGEVWQGIGQSALNAITGYAGRMVENWISSQFAMSAAEGAGEAARAGIKTAGLAGEVALTTAKTGVHLTGEGVKTGATAVGVSTRTGIEAAGASASIAMSAGVALADVANSAIRAAAGAYAAIAGIPIIGPVLAPLSAAAALAAVLAMGKAVFSARNGVGSVENDGDMYELHREEMVLPRDIANPLRSQLRGMGVGPVGQAASGGLSGGAAARTAFDTTAADAAQRGAGGAAKAEFHFHSFDGRDAKRVMKRAGPQIVEALMGEARKFNVKPAGG